mmetsp:Transcript_32018/g.63430  ORF Transcript_32018/g.63430 Transcript_32018/m.63430 type:complete len:871 (+) Transcript_32018:215-2827(+)
MVLPPSPAASPLISDAKVTEFTRIENPIALGAGCNGASETLNTIAAGVRIVIPHMEPISPRTFAALTCVCAFFAASFNLVFSACGFGAASVSWSRQYAGLVELVVKWLAFSVLALYLADVEQWNTPLGRTLRGAYVAAAAAACASLVLFTAGDYPYGSLCLFVVSAPAYLLCMKALFWPREKTRNYVAWLTGPLLAVGTATVVGWVAWTAVAGGRNQWGQYTRLAYSAQAGCTPDFSMRPGCADPEWVNGTSPCFYLADDDDATDVAPSYAVIYDTELSDMCGPSCLSVYDGCTHAFVLWVWPLMSGMAMLFLSFVCAFFWRKSGTEDGPATAAAVWSFLFFGMWVLASVAGFGAGLTEGLTAFILALFVAAGGVVLFCTSGLVGRQMWRRLEEKYKEYDLDYAWSLLVATCLPVFCFYLVLSIINQRIRRLRSCVSACLCGRPTDDQTNWNGWLTEITAGHFDGIKKWHLPKLCTWAIYWGIAFMTITCIITQFTTLFLSYLIEKTAAISNGRVAIIFGFVAIILFLLPPVPGVPIYLTAGIVLVNSCIDDFGLIGSVGYTICICFILKLVASAVQQKYIGEGLSHYVSIRQLVAINSRMMRTAKLILSDKGVTKEKIFILIGGPDWPTSVLCGVMRLDLMPCLLATSPVIFLIIPTVLSGTFIYLGALPLTEDGLEPYTWAKTASTLCVAVSALVQGGAMLLAAYYIERAVQERKEELQRVGYDDEVSAADLITEEKNRIYFEVLDWHRLPLWVKIDLITSLLNMVMSCYIIQIFGHTCFVEYELTYTISEHLGGNALNLVRKTGWLALGMFFFSCTTLYIFKLYAKNASAACYNNLYDHKNSSNAPMVTSSDLLIEDCGPGFSTHIP